MFKHAMPYWDITKDTARCLKYTGSYLARSIPTLKRISFGVSKSFRKQTSV
jgi:hypothetical protein